MTTPHPRRAGGHRRLTIMIVAAIVLAILLSMLAPGVAVHLDLGGEIFLRLLQMVVVPLVMASVMSGILGLGDVTKLGRPGGVAISYYLSTTLLAVITGLVLVNLIRPGDKVPPKLVQDARVEGANAVREAKSAANGSIRRVTWGPAGSPFRGPSSTSNPLTVPANAHAELLLELEQLGAAREPARIDVLARSEEGAFEVLETFVAGVQEGAYTQSIRLGKEVRAIKLEYRQQQGGTASIASAQLDRGPPSLGDIAKNLILMLFTGNLLQSMVEVNLLPVIVFSIVFAGMLTTMGDRSQAVQELVVSINDALMSFILLLMKLAPLGIFCLVAARFGKAQQEGQFLQLLQTQFYYMFTVISGLGIHALLTLPLALWLLTRRKPWQFMGQMSQAVLTAFSTASSTATLPVTMECAEVRARVSRRSTEFVLPLGATINMDGTALYEAAAAIFIAQALGVELGFAEQVTIAITATLAAIGAAGIPEAGLVTMLIVLNAVGLPLELIGLILPVDWLLDRFRTAVNAFGDSVGAAIVDGYFDHGQEKAS